MRRKQALVVGSTLLLAAAVVALVFAAAGQNPPAGSGTRVLNPVTVPTLMISGNCCLTRFNKLASGQRTITFEPAYGCDVGTAARGATKIRLLLNGGGPCDQNPALVPNGSFLEANGSTIRREDGYAVFTGDFTIKASGATLFTGTMELLDQIGSHQTPFGAETCGLAYHQEGWLSGTGGDAMKGYRLHAAIVARGALTPTSGPQALPAPVRIVGMLVKCP
jgi:hypothetical protein